MNIDKYPKNKQGQHVLPQEEFNDVVDNLSNSRFYPIQKFFFVHEVLNYATATTIGGITKDTILAILENLFLPVIGFIGKTGIATTIGNQIKEKSQIVSVILTNFGNIIWWCFIWIATSILAYWILEHILHRWFLNMKTTIPNDQLSGFVKSNLENRNIEFDYRKFYRFNNNGFRA